MAVYVYVQCDISQWLPINHFISFNSVTVARPAPPDVPVVSTPLVSESAFSKLILM